MKNLRLSATPHIDAIRDIVSEMTRRKEEVFARLEEIRAEMNELVLEKDKLNLELSDINYALPKASIFKKYTHALLERDQAPEEDSNA
jgi:hypothetical protein